MKMDAENTRRFRAIMTAFDPDVFVDTHSTNGADYQYSMTLIPYQSERWPTDLSNVNHAWYKGVYDECNKSYKTQHYVNVWGRTPETGFSAFQTTSVYSTGYAGLNRTIGLTTEAHMFKPYEERVEATMATLDAVLKTSIELEKDIKIARERALAADMHFASATYPVEWELDSSVVEEIDFEGYKADFFTSELTGQQRYRYDQEHPETFRVKYYPQYKIKKVADIPKYYILRKGQHKAIANLMAAGVQFEPLEEDMDMSVRVHYVKSIEYTTRPYEGHFPHKSFETEDVEITAHFKAGDIKIPVNQRAARIIIEALEPHAPGSLFRWNYFDTYLQQKEWFSAYVFEEKAIAFLEENPAVKAEFETWRETTEGVESNAFAQLYWIYKKTPYYEKEHMMIPVFRIY